MKSTKARMDAVKAARKELGMPVGIMLIPRVRDPYQDL